MIEAESPVVVATGLSHRFGERVALRDISFGVVGGVTGLVGVNGAGKSTLLRILATDLSPDDGDIELTSGAGRTGASRLAWTRRRVAMMPQTFVPPSGVTAAGFLHCMAWLRGVARQERAAAAGSALEMVGLSGRRDDRIDSLSGGMVRRLLLAQAILGDPELLLLDEPTAGLDPEQRVRIRALISAQAELRAVVVSTHIMEDVVHIADRIVMLDEGAIVFDGVPNELADLGRALVGADAELSVYEAAFLHLRRRRLGDR